MGGTGQKRAGPHVRTVAKSEWRSQHTEPDTTGAERTGAASTAAGETAESGEEAEKEMAGSEAAVLMLLIALADEVATLQAARTSPAARRASRRFEVDAESVAIHKDEVVAEAARRIESHTALAKFESWLEERLE